MSDDAHIEAPAVTTGAGTKLLCLRPRGNRLVDHLYFVPQTRFQLLGRLRLKHDETRGEFERFLRPAASRQIVVKVRSRKGYNKRAIGIGAVKAADRGIASPGMQGNQQVIGLCFVGLRDTHAVPESSQNARPAKRGDPVAITRSRRRRRDDSNVHCFMAAQVRKPAQTSRR
jgi:hypothetical protein